MKLTTKRAINGAGVCVCCYAVLVGVGTPWWAAALVVVALDAWSSYHGYTVRQLKIRDAICSMTKEEIQEMGRRDAAQLRKMADAMEAGNHREVQRLALEGVANIPKKA